MRGRAASQGLAALDAPNLEALPAVPMNGAQSLMRTLADAGVERSISQWRKRRRRHCLQARCGLWRARCYCRGFVIPREHVVFLLMRILLRINSFYRDGLSKL